MLYKRKLSKYKIKKILICFVNDQTSIDASKYVKVNRNTTNRYYSMFRKIICDEREQRLLFYSHNCKDCLGYIKTEATGQVIYKVLSIKTELFFVEIFEKPKCHKLYYESILFFDFLRFHYKRRSKFHGLTKHATSIQLKESSFRFQHTKDEIHQVIWKALLKNKFN